MTSGQPVLCMECLWGTEISLFSTKCTCGGSTVNSEVINDQHCWLDSRGAGSTVNSERVNSQQWGDWQSTVNNVDHWLPHCWLSIASLLTVDCWSPHCWLSTLSLLIIDHLTVDCWASITSLLTLSLLTVDPPPRINSQQCWLFITSLLTINPLTVDRWSPHCWLLSIDHLTVDPLTVDCWSSPPGSTVNSVDHWLPHLTQPSHCWSLIASLLTVEHWSPHCWPSHCWLLTLSLLTVDPLPQDQQSTVLIIDCLTFDHWPSHCWLSTLPPGSTVNSVDHQLPHYWPLTLSLLTVDPPPYRFQLCNL